MPQRDEMNHGLFSVLASEVYMGLLMDGNEEVTEVLLSQFDAEQLAEIIAKAEVLAEMAARIRRSQ